MHVRTFPRSRTPLALLAMLALAAGSVVTAPPAADAAQVPELRVLSGRADLISGGDALVEVALPAGTDPALVVVTVDGRDVSDAFDVRDDGRFLGLVEDLEVGTNLVAVDVRPSARSRAPAGRSSATIEVTNHPVGGPVFSGPHLQPWLCTTVAQGLGEPLDDDCNAPTRVDWFYQRTSGGALVAYDPGAPAADVATTTTDDGTVVPFIVRRERGTMNRGIYDVAVLADPAEDITAWSSPAGWNGKVVWAFGPSAGTVHSQGSTQSVLSANRLGAGFMVANNSLNTHGSNSNTVVSAEAVMMLKEHITERYGDIRYTIGQGGSGGAIGQHVVANTYPGLIDGLMPQLTFTDTWTTGVEVVECTLLNSAASALIRTPFTGHANTLPCTLWQLAFGGNTNPATGCGLPTSVMYHPVNNPDGVRCTPQDYAKNVWGLRDDGIANNPSDNVGVQYGLNALLAGRISPANFVTVNATIGSLNDDGVRVPGVRREADPGSLVTAYRTGGVTDGRQLDLVPIIDLRASENSGIHTNYHTYAMRERLVEANGHADNHVIWSTTAGNANAFAEEAFLAMDAWLAAIEADDSGASQADKVLANRPAGLVDTCFIGATRSTDPAVCGPGVPYFASPRIAAGGPTTHDVLKCQLKPLDPADYPGVTFTAAQWAQLETAFPTGVCDWTQPGVDVQPSVPWLTYTDGPGGQELPPAPTSTPGCAGRSTGQGQGQGDNCSAR
jgi:hypothetical protein